MGKTRRRRYSRIRIDRHTFETDGTADHRGETRCNYQRNGRFCGLREQNQVHTVTTTDTDEAMREHRRRAGDRDEDEAEAHAA